MFIVKLVAKGVIFIFTLVIFVSVYDSLVLYFSGDNSKQMSQEIILKSGTQFKARLIHRTDKLVDEECQVCVDFIEQEVSVIAILWADKNFLKYEFQDNNGDRQVFSLDQDKDKEVKKYLDVVYARNDGPFSVFIGTMEQLARQQYATSDHLWDAILSLLLGIVMIVAGIYM